MAALCGRAGPTAVVAAGAPGRQRCRQATGGAGGGGAGAGRRQTHGAAIGAIAAGGTGAPSGSDRGSRGRVLARSTAQTTPMLKSSGMQGQVDPAYLAAANYLRSIGLANTAEIARVLDVAMNPNSLFVSYNDTKRSRNANARPLSVEADMQPVVEFLQASGLSQQQIVQVVAAHPPVLSYSVAGRLEPFWGYLRDDVGVADVAAAVASRPSLLGLDVDAGLRKIVDYLRYVQTPPDKIVHYITTSI